MKIFSALYHLCLCVFSSLTACMFSDLSACWFVSFGQRFVLSLYDCQYVGIDALAVVYVHI